MPSGRIFGTVSDIILRRPESWGAVMEDPGLVSITVGSRQVKFPEPTIQIRLEPSKIMPHGVFILVNHSVGLKRDKMFQQEKIDLFLHTLQQKWDSMEDYSLKNVRATAGECRFSENTGRKIMKHLFLSEVKRTTEPPNFIHAYADEFPLI